MKRIQFTLMCVAFAGFVLAAGPAFAGCGSCEAGESHAACTECKEGELCAKCAETKAEGMAAAHHEGAPCPSCTEGKMCEKCAEKQEKMAKAFWSNEKCPIMGGKVNPASFVAFADPKTHTYANIYVCCAGCQEKIKADPAAAFSKAYLDREVKNNEGKVIAKKGEVIDLKNKTCPVSGGKVSDKVSLVYNGYKVGLCCPGCEKAFVKDADVKLMNLVMKEELKVPGKKLAKAPAPEKSAAAQN